MKFTRRDLLIGGAGAVAGLVLTPVPWKLLSDVSIWTQNFPWIPQPAHGPVETKYSTCTLCEAGCGIRVRMAANCPVGVAGVSESSANQGRAVPACLCRSPVELASPPIARSAPRRARGVLGGGRRRPFRKLVTRDPSPSSMAGREGPLRRCSKHLPESTAAATRPCSARRVRHSPLMPTGAGFPWLRLATIWKTRAPS